MSVSSPMLLLDIGNSRVKAAWADDAEAPLRMLPTEPHDADPAGALARLTLPPQAPAQIWISHVLGAAGEAALDAAVESRWRCRPQYARAVAAQQGLRSAYVEPARLGVDRWLAMLAAYHLAPAGAVVVDAGTALTTDVIGADGEHRGGTIGVGLLTAQRAVLGATRFATRDLSAGYDGGLGRDTETCVRQGAMLACLGAIDRAAALAGPDSARFITGGDATQLLPYLTGPWQHRPLLVLEGLRWCAAAASPAALAGGALHD
jgi:type III pantothenate kinase